MSTEQISLKTAIERLDVLCEVINAGLQMKRVTKTDLVLLRDASQRVIESYEKEMKRGIERC